MDWDANQVKDRLKDILICDNFKKDKPIITKK
jgi:hypothetical protein